MSQKDPFQFLSDFPLCGDDCIDQSQFGHRDIGETLSQIIQNCPAPFTIGLFGKWGSGKSTIANIVSQKLAKASIPVVSFDTWKHEGDSLRRSFLKELVLQLKSGKLPTLDNEFQLDDNLELKREFKRDSKMEFNPEKGKQFLWIGIPLLVFLTFLGFISYAKDSLKAFLYMFNTLLGGGIVIWLLNYYTQIFNTKTTTFTKEKLQDPHEFEKEFANIINKVKAKRILIIFDNLDRVMYDKALEILATIKTFLEPIDISIQDKEIVFLIPCDDKAIRAHINAKYEPKFRTSDKEQVFGADEFLRKFFNTVLWIPDFISSELERFTHNCLIKTNIAELNDHSIAWLITKAFRENPRQIIQFTNILVSNIILIKEREGEKKDFEKGYTENNKIEICLYLILNHIYPALMAEIRIQKIATLSELNSIQFDDEIFDKRITSKFIGFINEVQSVATISNLKALSAFRKSDQEKKFPGIEELFESLKNNELDNFKEIPQIIEMVRGNINHFSAIVHTYFESIRNSTSKAYFIDGVLTICDSNNIVLHESCYGQFHNAIISKEFEDKVELISPSVIYSSIIQKYNKFKTRIINSWLQRLDIISIGDEKQKNAKLNFIEEVLSLIANDPNLVFNSSRKFHSLLETRFPGDVKVGKLFCNSLEAQKAAFSEQFINSFVKLVSIKDLDSIGLAKANNVGYLIPEGWQILLTIDSNLMNEINILGIARKYSEMLTQIGQLGWDEDIEIKRNTIFISLAEFLDKIGDKVKDPSILNNMTDSAILNINHSPEWMHKNYGMAVLFRLNKMVDKLKKDEVAAVINKYYVHAPADALKKYVELIGGAINLFEGAPYRAIIVDRSISEPGIFDIIYPVQNEDERMKLLLRLINTDVNKGLERLKLLKYDIPQKLSIVKRLLDLAKDQPASSRIAYYNTCINIGFDDNHELTSQYSAQLIELMKSTDLSVQKIGADFAKKNDLFSREIRRSMTKEIYSWIQKQDTISKYQPHSLEFLINQIGDLAEYEKRSLSYICFDDLIVNSNNLNSIIMGFNILANIKGVDIDWNKNYIDVKGLFNKTPDAKIKTAIINGLKPLQPKFPNDDENSFWEWHNSLVNEN